MAKKCSISAYVERRTGELSVNELKSRANVLLKLAHEEESTVDQEKLRMGKSIVSSSRILFLLVFLDADGRVKVRGRLEESNLTDKATHQVILAESHPLTRFIIHYQLLQLHHAEFELLWSNLHQEYWIVNAQPCIHNFNRECLKFGRLRPTSFIVV